MQSTIFSTRAGAYPAPKPPPPFRGTCALAHLHPGACTGSPTTVNNKVFCKLAIVKLRATATQLATKGTNCDRCGDPSTQLTSAGPFGRAGWLCRTCHANYKYRFQGAVHNYKP